MYILDTNSKEPLYLQLYKELKRDIVNNLNAGDKLPSIRKLSSIYNLSKTTVINAYSQLYAEGYIDSAPKVGYYVVGIDPKPFKESSFILDSPNNKEEFKYDFFPARLVGSDFPLKIYKRLFNKTIDESIDFGAYPEAKGEAILREQIAKYLQSSRAVKAKASNVIITHGFADSMELLAKLLKSRYSNFGIENPGYRLAYMAFKSFNYTIEQIPLTKGGIDLDILEASKAEIIYITPSHQYPTGIVMPIDKRVQLIETMAKRRGVIIEDDYDSELSYTNRPIPSLQGLDSSESVVYLGTFAKSLSPAIRVGYMVVPDWILELFNSSYDAHFSRVSITEQLTLAKFIEKGHFERHIRKIRTLNRKKHNQMLKSIQKHLKNYKVVAQGAGLAILITPTKPFDWQKLKELAKDSSIKIYLTQDVTNSNFKAVRLGFGGFKLDTIDDAIIAFSQVWKNSFL